MLKFLTVLAVLLSGCSSQRVSDEHEKLLSNKVVYPAHMYNGVLVQPSWNWTMGHGKGVRLNEKLQIIEVREGLSDSDDRSKSGNSSLIGGDRAASEVEVSDALVQKSSDVVSNVCKGSTIGIGEPGDKLGSWKAHFKSDKDVSYDLDMMIGELKALNPSKVVVSGYTDDKGDDVYNERLSERRALSVSEELRKVWSGAEFKIIWGGECPKLVLNKDDESRQKNRRVEIMAYK